MVEATAGASSGVNPYSLAASAATSGSSLAGVSVEAFPESIEAAGVVGGLG